MNDVKADAQGLAAEWVANYLITKSKQRDLYRTRAAIHKAEIEQQLVEQTDDFLEVFYSEVEKILAGRAE